MDLISILQSSDSIVSFPLFCIIISLVFLIIFLFFNKRSTKSPPIAHIGLPFIGNYIEFAKGPVEFIEKGYQQYGHVFTVQMLHKNLTFLLGPEASAPFYRLGDDYMSQSEVYSFMTPVFGKGVVYDAEPKKRAIQYQTMATGLKSNRLKVYVPKIEMEMKEYLKSWGDSGTVNLLDALSELTILTSSRCLHGDDVREQLFADVARLYHDLDKGVSYFDFMIFNIMLIDYMIGYPIIILLSLYTNYSSSKT